LPKKFSQFTDQCVATPQSPVDELQACIFQLNPILTLGETMPDHLQASPEFAFPQDAKFKSRKKAADSPGLDLQRISFYDDDILNGTRTLNTQATSNQQTCNE